MEHLNTHAHAYIDKDNKVVNILVFQEKDHDSDLLNDFLPFNNAVKVVCCCSFGLAGIGHTWTGTEFQTPAPYLSWVWDSAAKIWNPPVEMPEDGEDYVWDEDAKNWKQLPNPRIASVDNL